MSCCDNKKAIVIVKGDDTDFNGQPFLRLYLNSQVYDLSTMKAMFSLFGIDKIYEDLSAGYIDINYTSVQTATFPIGMYNGVLRFYDSEGRKATAESFIPFCVIANVHGDAIATKPFEMIINVEQAGQNVIDIQVQAGVSVEVSQETETLPAGSSAYVQNIGTPSHLVLKFGIPQGEKGEDGAEGPEGPAGKDGVDGKDAKINGVNTLTLNATNGLELTQSGNVATISGKTIQDSVTSEALNRSNADTELQRQIDAIVASSDVTDIVGTYAQLLEYDTSTLPPNSIIKVLQDESKDNETTYYRWVITEGVGAWVLIGEEGPYYTKSEADGKFVPKTTTINGKALSGNISLDASDVGAATSAQGAKADTAVQPSDLGSAAYENSSSFATAAQGAKADTAVQPAAIANMATTNTAQDITATKTFKAQQKLQYGGGDSCLIIGADVTSNTVTANTRKLGRMTFHTNESTTLNCAFVSTDTQSATSASVIMNCVEFGGRPADTSSTSPDILNFTVAKVHNTTTVAEKQLALSITKDGAEFAVQPKYNGEVLVRGAQVGSISTPVYVNNNGVATACTGVQEKSTIQTLSATDSITLTDNYLYNGNTQTALTIALPTADVGFVSQITFTSGTTATTLSYPNSIKWLGDDVNNNIFLPVASKRYTVVFYYDGTQFVGVVKGVV